MSDLHPMHFGCPALVVFRARSADPAGNLSGRVPRWAGAIYLHTDHGQDERALRRMMLDEELRDAAMAVLALAAGRMPVSRLLEFLDAEL